MKTLPVKDARKQFSTLLADASKGSPTTITRRGIPTALITPFPTKKPKLASLQAFRNRQKPKGSSMSKTVINAREESRY